MKFNKLMHVAMSSATVLSALAVAAPAVSTFAADHPEQADALPQSASTTAGISFGNTDDTGHTGYLRLQYVPTVLDFGNHETYSATGSHNYTANGVELGSKEDSTGYEGGQNQTKILNTNDTKLADVNGKTWVTVVDKQGLATSDMGTKDDASDDTAYGYGDWNLTVQSDSKLAKTDDAGKASTTDVLDGTIGFNSTAYGQTNDIKALTNDSQDDDWNVTTDGTKTAFSSNIVLPLDASGTAQNVATADADQGQGANVYAWDRNNITLTLPTKTNTGKVSNGIYTAQLTWTLNTGI